MADEPLWSELHKNIMVQQLASVTPILNNLKWSTLSKRQ